LRLHQLGDAEVEQLHRAVGGHEDVARLDVAVDHEPAVRMRHGGEHVGEEGQALLDVQMARVAPAVDALAVDELEHQVRLPAGRHAGVHQPRDVRMGKARQHAALALEAPRGAVAQQREMQQLDRHVAFEAAIGTPGAPHAAAAALPDRVFEDVGADGLAGVRGVLALAGVRGRAAQ
jgi:hypothetical protein